MRTAGALMRMAGLAMALVALNAHYAWSQLSNKVETFTAIAVALSIVIAVTENIT